MAGHLKAPGAYVRVEGALHAGSGVVSRATDRCPPGSATSTGAIATMASPKHQKVISTPTRAAIGAWYATGCLYCWFGEAGLPFWSSVV